MLQALDYYYDRQQLRFMEQIVRAFSGIQYMTGSRAGLAPQLMQVPVRMASTDQTVSNLMSSNSENTLLTTPLITVWQTGLVGRPEDLQNRNFISQLQVNERAINQSGEYTGDRGQGYMVERLMPLPFNMMVEVDVWTSNLDQKYQIEEQILINMWPSFDIQNSQNALDWTALSTIYFEEINHTTRTIPTGTDTQVDIFSVNLRLPIWLTPPARVTSLKVIQQIITNIGDTPVEEGVTLDSDVGDYAQLAFTPGNHHINVDGGQISLLGSNGAETDHEGKPYEWFPFITLFGQLRPAQSQLILTLGPEINGPQVVGTIQYSSDPTKLVWQINPDTLPANTLAPINAIINPLETYPGKGLPSPVIGARYLILNDISSSQAWGVISGGSAANIAHYGDIIQYTNNGWVVSFEAMTATPNQFVVNLYSGSQWRWTGKQWIMAINAEYPPGYWRLNL